MTDPRDLIHGLAQSVEILLEMSSADAKPMRITEKRLDEARAYLARTEPEELSHETAARNAVESCLAQREEVLKAFIAKHGFCPEEAIQVEQRLEDGSTTWRIERRAALTQPKPKAPTDEELLATAIESELVAGNGTNPFREDSDIEDEVVQFARAVLARWSRPSIEPVPVSERLPKAEDCDAQGNCWLTNDSTEPGWVLDNSEKCTNWTHWLPHWALPVPTQHGCTERR
jgi:hypothetical protein